MSDRQIKILRMRAAEGDTWAQKYLSQIETGELAAKSRHSTRVNSELQAWMQSAAEGDPQAQFLLGWEYVNGKNGFCNLKAGVKWFRRAAEQGYVPAQRELGCLYYEGEGIEKDRDAALGNAKAQYMVYLKSGATELYWLLRAAEQGLREAEGLIKECKIFRDEEGQLLVDLVTPGALQFLLGVFHEKGRLGAVVNMKTAVEWYLKAAEKGCTDALFRMGECYEHGIGVEANPDQTRVYYRRASEHGYREE